MSTKIVWFILFLIIVKDIYCEQLRLYSPSRPRYKLRKFGFYDANQQNDLVKAYEIQLKLHEHMKNQKQVINNQQLRKKDAKNLNEKQQMKFVNWSSFIKDFLTNLF